MRAKNVLTIVLVLIIYSLSYGNLVQNPSMEGNFIYQDPLGNVAEYWTGWRTGIGLLGQFSEGSNAYDGAKSQQIRWDGYGQEDFGPDGIYQQINSLQPNRVYRVTTWFKFIFDSLEISYDSSFNISYSIGTDPSGGTDPAVVKNWMTVSDYEVGSWVGPHESPWINIVMFFSSSGTIATFFIEVVGSGESRVCDPFGGCGPVEWHAEFYIDDVAVDWIQVGQGSTVETTSPVPANGTNCSEVTITVVDSNSNPIQDIPPSEIIVNCTGSGNTIIGPDQPTDANGQTTAKITSIVAETKTITVTVLGTLLTDTSLVEFKEPYFGPDWYVDANNSGYGNGSKEYPFRYICDAIIPAQDGDTITVSPGRYYENIDFSGKELTVRSTNPEDWSVVKATIIDANGSGSVVRLGNWCVLSGFTITGGKSENGGGINCGGSPAITNCIITGNKAKYGGGIYCGSYSQPRIEDCIISNNVANQEGGGLFSKGLFYNCGGTIKHCLIANNSSLYGGGLYDCDGKIVNCTISDNKSAWYYGGLLLCNGIIQSCIIWGNTAGTGNQLYSCSIPTYSCIQDWTGGGIGNISGDPLFADADQNDFHLRSTAGRWDPQSGTWVTDANTSPCIDAGDPLSRIGVEPNPNGGRINIGFYGGTREASKSPSGIVKPVCSEYPAMDLNKDCKVDLADLAMFCQSWLECNLDPPELCW